ncbi:MAG: AbrB/MazE/SpoVT family DNA-binding domain-containing protein [Armatimonadota bacterium]
MPKKVKTEDNFVGTVTVGERGQIVIPSEARKKLDINAGEKLLVISHPSESALIICKMEQMRDFMTNILDIISKAESKIAENK